MQKHEIIDAILSFDLLLKEKRSGVELYNLENIYTNPQLLAIAKTQQGKILQRLSLEKIPSDLTVEHFSKLYADDIFALSERYKLK